MFKRRKADAGPKEEKKHEEEYLPFWIGTIPAREGCSFLQPLENRPPLLIQNWTSFLLSFIRGCKTIDRHIQTVTRETGGSVEKSSIEETFNLLRAENLLLTKTEFLNRIDRHEDTITESSPQPIEQLCWTTCNNSSALIASIQSYYQGLPQDSGGLRYSVFDDSKSQDKQEEYRISLKKWSVESGTPVFYCGRIEREHFIERFFNSSYGKDIPQSLLRFALFGMRGWENTVGSNRNSMLLSTVGGNFISTDDDMYGTYTDLRKDGNKTLTLSCQADPTEISLYPSEEELLYGAIKREFDIVQEHNRFVGKSVGRLINLFQGNCQPIDMEEISGYMIKTLIRADKKIRAVGTGVFGDSGMQKPHALFMKEIENRNDYLACKKNYLNCLQSRMVSWGAQTYTISESNFFRAGNVSLYNQEMLPPFMPSGRNVVILFSLLLVLCYFPGSIAHLPYGVYHKPSPPRFFTKEILREISSRLCDIIYLIVKIISIPDIIIEPNERLRFIGSTLVSVGSASQIDFEEYLQYAWYEQVRNDIAQLERMLKKHREEPGFWAEDVYKIIEGYENATVNRAAHVPSDHSSSLSPNSALEDCKAAVKGYGELLMLWPEIWSSVLNAHQAGMLMPVRL